jgi:hypothetical protein
LLIEDFNVFKYIYGLIVKQLAKDCFRVRYQVLTVVSGKMRAFWDIVPSSLGVDQHSIITLMMAVRTLKWQCSPRLHGIVSQKALVFNLKQSIHLMWHLLQFHCLHCLCCISVVHIKSGRVLCFSIT